MKKIIITYGYTILYVGNVELEIGSKTLTFTSHGMVEYNAQRDVA